jgi:hypothetical protein
MFLHRLILVLLDSVVGILQLKLLIFMILRYYHIAKNSNNPSKMTLLDETTDILDAQNDY